MLAEVLTSLVSPPALVLGIPRGGVVVAARVASRLGVPLDVVVPRKIGAPGNPELAVGAVADGVQAIDEPAVRRLGLDMAAVRAEAARQTEAPADRLWMLTGRSALGAPFQDSVPDRATVPPGAADPAPVREMLDWTVVTVTGAPVV